MGRYEFTRLLEMKLSFLLYFILFSLNLGAFDQFVLANKDVVKIDKIFRTEYEIIKGLSGIASDNFADDEAALFVFRHNSDRQFGMPQTFFNIDIVYLDKDLSVVHIDRDMEKSPYFFYPISTGRVTKCHYVLEFKSSSPYVKTIQKGDKLKWKSDHFSLEQISGIIPYRKLE